MFSKRGLVILATLCVCHVIHGTPKQLLVVSMDGFRADYITKYGGSSMQYVPNFKRFIANGVQASYMKPSFPTLTYPTHYTLVTGLHPENHGIVGNVMYDPVFREKFNPGTYRSKWWDSAYPIWTDAVRTRRKVGVYFWPGSYSVVGGVKPTTYVPYDSKVPNERRIDTVVCWLTQHKYDMALLYLSFVDRTGHLYGPDSSQMQQAVRDMDKVIGYMMQKLWAAAGGKDVNVILVGDHGMASVDSSRSSKLINIDDCVPKRSIAFAHSGTVVNVFPNDLTSVASMKQMYAGCSVNMNAYTKQTIPANLHFSQSRRIGPIILVAKEGYYIIFNNDRPRLKGEHGYNNEVVSMRTVFMALGPSFKVNFKTGPIDQVDVYPLMCKLIGLIPRPHNGAESHTSGMLRT